MEASSCNGVSNALKIRQKFQSSSSPPHPISPLSPPQANEQLCHTRSCHLSIHLTVRPLAPVCLARVMGSHVAIQISRPGEASMALGADVAPRHVDLEESANGSMYIQWERPTFLMLPQVRRISAGEETHVAFQRLFASVLTLVDR